MLLVRIHLGPGFTTTWSVFPSEGEIHGCLTVDGVDIYCGGVTDRYRQLAAQLVVLADRVDAEADREADRAAAAEPAQIAGLLTPAQREALLSSDNTCWVPPPRVFDALQHHGLLDSRSGLTLSDLGRAVYDVVAREPAGDAEPAQRFVLQRHGPVAVALDSAQ